MIMEVTREEMLELAKRETFHLDDRLCPFDRETLRAEAWLQGYEFAKRNEKKEEAEPAPIDGRIPDEVFPFYPVKAGDEFYCTNSCSVADTDGRDRYIAYTDGKTYVSEKDGCITDDQGCKDHSWSPDGFGIFVGNFLRKIKHGPKLIMEGSWVVHGKQTCRVLQVIEDKVMVAAPSLFGNIQTLYFISDVRPWTLADTKKGDFLAVDDEMIFISKGADDNVCNYFACYDLKMQQFYDDDGCSSTFKDKMRPATDEEVLLLKEQIDIHGYHWNLDKMELEEKRKENIRTVFPQSDYAQLQQDMNELSNRVKTLEERLFHIESKDMPLGGNSCV
jgi:hypothetical protein